MIAQTLTYDKVRLELQKNLSETTPYVFKGGNSIGVKKRVAPKNH